MIHWLDQEGTQNRYEENMLYEGSIIWRTQGHQISYLHAHTHTRRHTCVHTHMDIAHISKYQQTYLKFN